MKHLFSLLMAVLVTTSLADAAKKPSWVPAGDKIKTRWAAEVNPKNPLPEYPRPQMVRSGWQSLNGLWDYAITPLDGKPEVKGKFSPDGQILVPFAVESSLSGVGRMVGRNNLLWYERTFTVPSAWKGKRVILHFGAVDWKAEVEVNGIRIGEHTGGYAPFSFDITDVLKKRGSQKIKVKVYDASDQAWQPRGKQVSSAQGIWYTPVTGIWQTVWLEAVEKAHIDSYLAVADLDNSSIKVSVEATELADGDVVRVQLLEGREGYSAENPSASVLVAAEGTEVTLPVSDPHTWSPDTPYLYGLRISILRGGKVLDSVEGYTAIRKISTIRTEDGYKRIALNNEALFQFGPLDQGWWPDGLYTAPTDEALRYDIERTKAWGFNMIRKHVKVEPARWYWWCDALGIIVWQDMPCIADHGKGVNATRDKDISNGQRNRFVQDSFKGGTDCIVPEKWKQNFYKEWGEIISCLKGFPCIAVWVPFNEAWGQFDTPEVVEYTRQLDSTRLINEASGGNFHLSGDILDIHHYPEPLMNVFARRMINVLGEYGGIRLPIKGHLWIDSDKNWGYGRAIVSANDLLERYKAFADRLSVLVSTGCAAAVYTQTTDVEIEINGLMTYDRIEKLDASALREVNERVIATPLFDAKQFSKR